MRNHRFQKGGVNSPIGGVSEEALREAFGGVKLFTSRSDGPTWDSILTIAPALLLASKNAGELVASIKLELDRLTAKALHSSNWLLSLPPMGPNGFAIDICRSGLLVRGLFGDLEEEFDALDGALIWARRALSDSYQLRYISVGNRILERRLEPVSGSGSLNILASGRVSFIDGFREKHTRILQNELPY